MSQHYFDTTHAGKKVRVQLGWDRPLSHFYLVVESFFERPPGGGEDLAEDKRDDYLYSNLYEANPFDKDLRYFRRKLRELGITVPDSMWKEVAQDEIFDVGNRYVWYSPDGSFKE